MPVESAHVAAESGFRVSAVAAETDLRARSHQGSSEASLPRAFEPSPHARHRRVRCGHPPRRVIHAVGRCADPQRVGFDRQPRIRRLRCR